MQMLSVIVHVSIPSTFAESMHQPFVLIRSKPTKFKRKSAEIIGTARRLFTMDCEFF